MPNLEVEKLIDPKDPAPIFHEKYLVRYASRKRLEDFRTGIVCFGPAKVYAQLSNIAQKDDELQRNWHVADTKLEISGVSYPASDLVLGRQLKNQNGDFVHYHCLSMSVEESPKLQRAFGAEGYVLIHDYKVFLDIISNALCSNLGPAYWCSRQVRYYDDRATADLIKASDLPFSKSMAFLYQNEVRIIVYDTPEPDQWLQVKVEWPPDLISQIRSF